MRGASARVSAAREDNFNKFVEVLDPVAEAMDLFADAVVALKLKVIAELVITAAQLAAAIGSAVVTFGIGAAAQVALIALRKKALDFATNVIIDELVAQLMPMLLEPLSGVALQMLDALLATPETKAVLGDPTKYVADYAALEEASSRVKTTGADTESTAQDFITKFMALQITTGA